jgi:hypothetical protein
VGSISAASARASEPSASRRFDRAASSAAWRARDPLGASSSCVVVATPRSTSVRARSKLALRVGEILLGLPELALATAREASASCTAASACWRERASRKAGATGSTMATTVSPATVASPTRTGERSAMPAMGEATS